MKKIIFFLVACLVLSGCSESGTDVTYYTLSFNGNGASGIPPSAVSVPELQYYAPLPGKVGLTNADKVFLNWNTHPLGAGISYNPGDAIQLFADTVLYAQWKDKETGKEYRTFWARDTDDNWYSVEAAKRAEGKSVIYVDILATDVTDNDIAYIKNKYDTIIHTGITGAFGTPFDIDKNGKVILLLLDIKDGYDPAIRSYVAGYFDSTHMYDTETEPFSNEADMLFIDTYPGLYDGENNGLGDELSQLCSTVAHELQHLINFSQTILATPPKRGKDLWIDEGLSSAAEYIYDPSDTSRIDYFNRSDTTIPNGNNFFVWNGYWEQEYGDVLADYATVHLFFRWLGIHASNGKGIYKEIIDNSAGDYQAVTAAASSKIDSRFSNWETLLSTWMLANYYKSPSGFYGYKGDIKPVVTVFRNTGNKPWPFSPGEGIFSEMGSYYGGTTGSNIRYRGLGGSSSTPAVSGIFPYTGDRLLTFNANSNYKGADETGYLASVTGTGPALSVAAGLSIRAAGVSAGGKAYPVSFGDKAAGLDKPGSPAKPGASVPRTKPGAR